MTQKDVNRLIDKYMDVESDKERNVISHLFK